MIPGKLIVCCNCKVPVEHISLYKDFQEYTFVGCPDCGIKSFEDAFLSAFSEGGVPDIQEEVVGPIFTDSTINEHGAPTQGKTFSSEELLEVRKRYLVTENKGS